MRTRFTRAIGLVGPLAMVAWMAGGVAGSAEATMPSGQVSYGNSTFDTSTGHFVGGGGTIEPAYDDTTGTLVYLQTPNNAPVNEPGPIDPATGYPVNVAPMYLPIYPAGSTVDPATLNCDHVATVNNVTGDNCPDHGPLIAGLVQGSGMPLYKDGVKGHDHLVGIASTGGDYNMIWAPVLVLFTSMDAANAHPTTLAQIETDLKDQTAVEFSLPPSTDFNCARVSAASYNRGTPAPLAPSVS